MVTWIFGRLAGVTAGMGAQGVGAWVRRSFGIQALCVCGVLGAGGCHPGEDDGQAGNATGGAQGSGGSAPSGCLSEGKSCKESDECCDGKCSLGACLAPDICANDGQSCDSTRCCAGSCKDGICISGASCAQAGESCSNKDCCSGSCVNSVCQEEPCSPAGSSCVDNACCDGKYCYQDVCQAGESVCADLGESCSTKDCCEYPCVDGMCVAEGLACAALGESCANNDCCDEYACKDSVCRTCFERDRECTSPAECCSGYCSVGKCQ